MGEALSELIGPSPESKSDDLRHCVEHEGHGKKRECREEKGTIVCAVPNGLRKLYGDVC